MSVICDMNICNVRYCFNMFNAIHCGLYLSFLTITKFVEILTDSRAQDEMALFWNRNRSLLSLCTVVCLHETVHYYVFFQADVYIFIAVHQTSHLLQLQQTKKVLWVPSLWITATCRNVRSVPAVVMSSLTDASHE